MWKCGFANPPAIPDTEMLKIALLSLLPFYLPASCWTAGCECEWLCSTLNAAACAAAAGLAAAGIFTALTCVDAFRGLGALRD